MKKRLWIPVLGLTAVMTLGGCAQQQSQLEYIGEERAQALALEASGISDDTAAVFTASSLDNRDGVDYYRIDFTAAGAAYQCDVDALTGTIIELREVGSAEDDDDAQPQAVNTDNNSGNTAENTTGSSGTQQNSGTNTASGEVIGETAAKEKALAHAGLSSGDVTFVKVQLDRDDGRRVYDVEFYTSDYQEYDYEVDAATGKILSYDYDAEHYTPPASSNGNQNAISEAKAKEIALWQVPGAAVSNIREFETDYDDGRLEYEGKIIYGNMEYEFTIDGYSGAIREWDAEPLDD